MSEFDLIATIGAKITNVQDVQRIIEYGFNHLRFNFSKYDKNLEDRVNMIRCLKDLYENDIKVLIDLPYPGKKARIYHNKNYFDIITGQELEIVSDIVRKESERFVTDLPSIGRFVQKDTIIVYSDGEALLRVIKVIDVNTILVRAESDFFFRNGKSLSFDYPKRGHMLEYKFVDIIRDIRPNEIALSFVENSEDIRSFKMIGSNCMNGMTILSKIETQSGIDHIDDICRNSDVIIGRGDMSINTDIHKLYQNQKYIVKSAKKCGRNCYIATGILNSLTTQHFPTQADIIDLSVIINMRPKGIILNAEVVWKRPEMVLKTITEVKETLEAEGIYN